MLTELSGNKIKWIRSLHEKKTRDTEGLYLIEGEKMVLEALKTIPEQIHTIVQSIVSVDRVTNFSRDHFSCSEKQLKQISTLKTPNKFVAVVRKKTDIQTELKGLILALDGIQDPGNMGTIMRIADWFGIDQIICSKDTVDCYNPKVVQSSMGAILRVQINYCDLAKTIQDYKGNVYGAFLEGNSIYQGDLKGEGVILLGNEGNGIRKELEDLVSDRIHIPSFGHAESLNVAVAAGIIVSEFRRRAKTN